MNKLWTLLRMIDDSLLSFLMTLFLFFIPLFPKIPFKTIEYTYVAIRPDDLFILAITLVFAVQLYRGKITLNKAFIKPFVLFWVSVFISYLIAIALTHTIVYRQVGLLHSLRRIEYMIIFFIASSQIKKVSDFTHYLFTISVSTFIVVIYGIGQRVAGLPSISTMNPEFARGRILFLTPEARIASTFAGHYDLAAFLVFFIPIMWGLYFLLHKKIRTKTEFLIDRSKQMTNKISSLIEQTINWFLSKVKHSNSFMNLLLTIVDEFEVNKIRLRNVFIAGIVAITFLSNSIRTYELAIGIVTILALATYILIYKKSKGLALLTLIALMLFVLVQTASRSSFFAYLASISLYLLYLRRYRYLVVVLALSLVLTYQNKNLSDRFSSTFQMRQFLVNDLTGEIFVLQRNKVDELPAGSRVLVKINDEKKKKRETYDETYAKNEFLSKASIAAELKEPGSAATVSSQYRQVQGIAPDISFDTRLQVEWPRAINAFKRNPLFGTGPSSITESTDNDFLRWLGELGLVGTGLFLYILFMIASQVHKMAKVAIDESKPIFYGFLFGLFGLLINALYIDVFEASKVAYMFWATSGIFSGLYILKTENES